MYFLSPYKGNFVYLHPYFSKKQDDNTYERETKALLAYAKRFDCKELFIITMDEEKEVNLDGNIIQIIPLWKMLLKGI